MTAQGSTRSTEVIALLRDGKSDRRIAKRLGMSHEEVRRIVAEVIAAARLDDAERVDALAEQVGIAAGD